MRSALYLADYGNMRIVICPWQTIVYLRSFIHGMRWHIVVERMELYLSLV